MKSYTTSSSAPAKAGPGGEGGGGPGGGGGGGPGGGGGGGGGEEGGGGRGWLGGEGTSYISSSLAEVAGDMSIISYPSSAAASPVFTFP